MSVAVDQTGNQSQTRAINTLIAIKTRRDLYDAPVLDGDIRSADRAAPCIKDTPTVQQRSHAGSIPPLPGALNSKATPT